MVFAVQILTSKLVRIGMLLIEYYFEMFYIHLNVQMYIFLHASFYTPY